MRIFKTKWFTRYAEREGIDNNSLSESISQAGQGLIDAELGGSLIKLRIAKKGRGKSSGFRTLVAYQKNEKAVFLYGFAKNERANIDDDELASLKEMAAAWLKATDEKINNSLSSGFLNEVIYEKI